MGWIALPEELKTFVSPHGKRAEVTVFKGRVTGASTWSETHVTSSGGGGSGYIHPQYGGQVNVQAPTISSYVNENRELFLSDGGKELSHRFVNANFPCREGHVMWFLYLTPEKSNPMLVSATNDTTEKRYSPYFPRWAWDRLTNTLEVNKRKFVEFVCQPTAIVVASIIDVFFVGLELCLTFAAIAGAIRVYTHFWDKRVRNNCRNALNAHLAAVSKIVDATPLEDAPSRPAEHRPAIAPVYTAEAAGQLAAAG